VPARRGLAARRVLAASVTGLVAAAVLVTSATAGTPRPRTTPAGACTDPITRDPYDGFQVGVPAGWNLLTLGDLLVVSKDLPQVEAAVVYPALLTAGQTPTHLFDLAMGELQQDAAANGGALNFHLTSSAGGLPKATLQGRGGGVAVSGQASVSILPDQTADGSKLVVVSAYWAPASSLRADQVALASVGACFQPRRATGFLVVQDPSFTYSIPPGWRVAAEITDKITIALANTAGATYYFVGVPPTVGANSAPTLLTYVFASVGIHITKTFVTLRFPSQVDPTGALDSFEYVEFAGTLQTTTPVRGLVSVYCIAGSAGTLGVFRYALAQSSAWNTYNGALRRIVGGIQHNFTQDLQQWEHLNQQWQTLGQQEQNVENIITGSVLAVDPNTGQAFDEPLNSYEPSGPNGPGYYNQGTKLNVLNPTG